MNLDWRPTHTWEHSPWILGLPGALNVELKLETLSLFFMYIKPYSGLASFPQRVVDLFIILL